MINKIEFLEKNACLINGFIWDNIPKFAVIAGTNGSGKTQLFNALFQASQEDSTSTFRTKSVTIMPNSTLKNQVQYIRYNHNIDIIGRNPTGTIAHLENQNTVILDYARKAKSQQTDATYNSVLERIQLQHNKLISELTDEQIIDGIPPEIGQYLDNSFNNIFIAQVFKAYQSKVEKIKLKNYRKEDAPTDEEIYGKLGSPPPWLVINTLFDKYDFHYHITPPIEHTTYVPCFIDKSNPADNSIKFSDLSSGEKIIVSLILWAYNKNLGDKNRVFLLDEFDAHLNPSMSKIFTEVVKEKLVNEFNIQVIMTTHSASTVAHVDDEDLFWMERGQSIRQRPKREIIRILSDGIMTYQEASSLLVKMLGSKKNIFIFTEGKTDAAHIKIAREKLGIDDCGEIIPVGDDISGGADKLAQFLISCPAELFKEHKVIGIFDYDTQGLKQQSYFNKQTDNLYCSKTNNEVYAVFLPTPQAEFTKYKNCPIEFLYSKEILETHQVITSLTKRNISEINNIRAKISESQLNDTDYSQEEGLWFYGPCNQRKAAFAETIKSLSPSHFENFKPLFDLLKSIYKPLPSESTIELCQEDHLGQSSPSK